MTTRDYRSSDDDGTPTGIDEDDPDANEDTDERDEGTPGPDQATDAAADTAHVLLLEDDDSLRRLLQQKLESSGYETTALADGRECWSFLTDEAPPDLVLLDVMVPGLDGFRLLGRIRNDDRLADVPVIVLTARGREEDVVKGVDLGADDYVTKPFSPAALVARVRRLLS